MKAEEHSKDRIRETKRGLAGKRVISVTIARGASKRLPRKNVLDFCGHPLVAWTIVHAKTSHLITDVYLSTDDEEIAEIGERYGAQIIWRSHELAELTAAPSFTHAIETIKPDSADLFLGLLPTGVIRQPFDFDEVIALYHELSDEVEDLVVAVLVPQLETVIHKVVGRYLAECVLWDKRWGYCTAGGAYSLMTVERYLRINHQMAGKTDQELDESYGADVRQIPDWRTYYYPLEIWQALDIDIKEHFDLARMMMRYYILKEKGIDVYYEYSRDYSSQG